MAIPQLVPDFSEFLNLLNSAGVEYLLVGGYAVGIHGYVRATGDLDIWIRISPGNARATETVLRQFGIAGDRTSERRGGPGISPTSTTCPWLRNVFSRLETQ